MSYTTPTGLTGTPSGLTIPLTWGPSFLAGPPPLLLLHFDGTNGQTTTVDSSPAANTVLVNAALASLSTSSPKFGTASLSMPNSNKFNTYTVAVPFAHNAALDIFTTSAWTIECFAKVTTTTFAYIFSYGGAQSTPAFSDFDLSMSDDGLGNTTVSLNDDGMFGTGQSITQVIATPSFQWHHIAVVLNAGVTSVYFDGVALTSTKTLWNSTRYFNGNASPNVLVGCFTRYSGGSGPAFVDEFAVWSYARYTANFTVPTAAFPDIASPTGDPDFNLVALLLPFDGSITDLSPHALPMTGPGTTESSQVLFGTGALNLPLAQAYSSTPVVANGPLDLGSTQQDWTIEGFVYLDISSNPSGNGMELVGAEDDQTNPAFPLVIATNNSGVPHISCEIFGNNLDSDIVANTWTHFAFTRHGNTYTAWVNGISVGAITSSSPVTAGLVPFFVGPFHFNGGNPQAVVGFMDEVRVTNGLARYTANFTPPGAAFATGVTEAPGYDVYRNGVSVGTFTGPATTGFIDTVPAGGTYTYNVAGWQSGIGDVSAQSSPYVVAIGQATGFEVKFVPASVFKAIMVANPGNINPRIYPPQVDTTIRVIPGTVL